MKAEDRALEAMGGRGGGGGGGGGINRWEKPREIKLQRVNVSQEPPIDLSPSLSFSLSVRLSFFRSLSLLSVVQAER